MYQPKAVFTCSKQSKYCQLFEIKEYVYNSKPMLSSELCDREFFG